MRDALLAIHFIGLAMGVGVGFAHLFIGIASAKMDTTQRLARAQGIVRPLGLMGDIGLGLLLISGFGMVHPYMRSLSSMPLLVAKFALVALLIAVFIPLKKLNKRIRNGDESAIAPAETMSKVTLLITLGIIVLAVGTFH